MFEAMYYVLFVCLQCNTVFFNIAETQFLEKLFSKLYHSMQHSVY